MTTVFGLSRREFAKELGCSVGWVQKLVETGRCVLTADGKIDGPASKARIAATADPGRRDVADRHAQARGAALAGVKESLTVAPGVGGLDELPAGSRAEAKAILMQIENGLMMIERDLRKGRRYDREAVRREAAALGSMLRAGIERVIDQTAPRLAATGDGALRRTILSREVARLRYVIKREMPRALRRMRAAGAMKRAEAGGA